MSGNMGEPLQLIRFTGDDCEGIELDRDTMDMVLGEVGDKKVVVISVCGPFGTGKSFLLNYFLRALSALERSETDKLGWNNKNMRLEGFRMGKGVMPETKGISVWSRPFIVMSDDGEDLAVILMDTEGTNSDTLTTKEMSTIVGLSLLTSSVTIFNIFDNLQEDVLQALSSYVQYGKLALEKQNHADAPFQTVHFLIRDWNNHKEFSYGSRGGRAFLQEKMKVKQDQPDETKHVRQSISECFTDLSAFLMPQIGEKARGADFTGSIAELSPTFATKLDEFISTVVSPEKIIVKSMFGNEVTGPQFRMSLEGYVRIFNSEQVPSAETMWKATLEMATRYVIERCLGKYRGPFQRQNVTNYLAEEKLQIMHKRSERLALQELNMTKAMGNQGTPRELQQKLQTILREEYDSIKEQNEKKRSTFICKITNDASTEFRETIESEFMLDDDDDAMDFYDDVKMKQKAKEFGEKAVEEFCDQLPSEEDEYFDSLTASLKAIFETILESHLRKNSAHRANAEEMMNKLKTRLVEGFQFKVAEYFNTYPFQDDEHQINMACEDFKSAVLNSFNEKKKPGRRDFQATFRVQLEKELENIFSTYMNKHKLRIGEARDKVENFIKISCGEYELRMREVVEDGAVNQSLLRMNHDLQVRVVVGEFASEVNPFPKGSPMSLQAESKLKQGLQKVLDSIITEGRQQREQTDQTYRDAVDHACRYYDNEMNKVVSSAPFLMADRLEKEHEALLRKAENEYEDFPKLGSTAKENEMKSDMRRLIRDNYKRLQTMNEAHRELAENQAMLLVEKYEKSYNNKMMANTEVMMTDKELEDSHNNIKITILMKLREECAKWKDETFIKSFENKLEEKIDIVFFEVKEALCMLWDEQKSFVDKILEDAKRQYHTEMEKHIKNDLFMKPEELVDYHVRTKALIVGNVGRKMTLTELQNKYLEKNLDELLQKYLEKNHMNANTEAPAIGIDLGTTYCCVAVYYMGKVLIVPNKEQGEESTTPSYVSFESNNTETIGKVAKDNAYDNPENTIYDAKRIIGRKIDDPQLVSDMKLWPFEVKQGEDGVPCVMANGKAYHPEEISAKLLKYLKEMAETFLKLPKGTIKKAVITVPAYFNDAQRDATVTAGQFAGLEVLTILNEPTAAAIAYSLERRERDSRKILVFDLGGGTFDVAVLDMSPQSIKVLGVKGDTHLGGEDFDKKMMEYCATEFKKTSGEDLFLGKDSTVKQERDKARRTLSRLQGLCEKAKKDLTTASTTPITIAAIINGKDLKLNITRAKFEELNAPAFQKSIDLIGETLNDLGLRKEDIHDIVLVGGSSRIPKIQRMLEAYFGGKALDKSINADEAVAYGAAVQAALLNAEQTKGPLKNFASSIQDVTPMSLGIEVSTKELSVILPKNSTIPTKRTEEFTTHSDNQTKVTVKIFEGENLETAAKNNLLGQFIFEGIPPARAGKEIIDVTMDINQMGILSVEATCRSTGGKKKIQVTENKNRMSEKTKRRIMAEA